MRVQEPSWAILGLVLLVYTGPVLSAECTDVGRLVASPSANASLLPGQCLVSPDKKTQAVMQEDGNLVVYYAEGTVRVAKWDSKTMGNAGSHLELQQDGNLVIYGKDHRALWQACTVHPFSNFFLQLQDDSNLVAYAGTSALDATAAVWSTMTDYGCSKKNDSCTWKWKPSGSNVLAFECK